MKVGVHFNVRFNNFSSIWSWNKYPGFKNENDDHEVNDLLKEVPRYIYYNADECFQLKQKMKMNVFVETNISFFPKGKFKNTIHINTKNLTFSQNFLWEVMKNFLAVDCDLRGSSVIEIQNSWIW